jgi:repressor LexA
VEKQLSLKQGRILAFLEKFVAEKSYPPTIRDIVEGCKFSSTSVVDYNLRLLEKHGLIRRHREISRGIELVNNLSRVKQVMVPLLGTIAAGKPIEVPQADSWHQGTEEMLTLGEDLVGKHHGVYALKVKGNSMVDALVNDGDIVLMKHINVVENGQMAAVWLKAEKEVTLKKFYAEKGCIRLQPANSTMKPVYTTADNAEVQGRVIAVIRRLS